MSGKENSREKQVASLPSPLPTPSLPASHDETVVIEDSLAEVENELLGSDNNEDDTGSEDAGDDGDVEMKDLTGDAGAPLADIARMYNNEQ